MSRAEVLLVPGPVGSLEVVVEPGEQLDSSSPLVAVIAHPHPLYGGTMDNKVVTTLSRMYRQLGVTVLRFNFRGVGASAGVHDEGRGEVDDMLAVGRYAVEHNPDAQLVLAGFSFGSAIAAAASEVLSRESLSTESLSKESLSGTNRACQHLVLVAPPVDRYSYAPNDVFACPTCVVIGGADDIVDADVVTAWVHDLATPPRLICIPQASHFFHGELITMKTRLEPEVRAMMAESDAVESA
ncbi:MAG: alpha/beta fold hydrolase [Porticoccaceae bacterium]